MKVKVDVDLCVGCGLCADTCPDVFVMEEEKARVKANPVPENSVRDCQKALEDCPVEAISAEE